MSSSKNLELKKLTDDKHNKFNKVKNKKKYENTLQNINKIQNEIRAKKTAPFSPNNVFWVDLGPKGVPKGTSGRRGLTRPMLTSEKKTGPKTPYV